MKRVLMLNTVGCAPPKTAQVRNGRPAVSLSLKPLFHHGFIEIHGVSGPKGKNPLYDEYTHLLEDEEFLVFKPPGIAVGDHRESDSQRLGRVFARGYLSEHHGYRWFANINAVCREKWHGWSASILKPGDRPDWLITRRGAAAVAEAKGTHRAVNAKSAKLWSQQVRNIKIERNGQQRALNTWVVATRWVTSDQPKTHPLIYAEDPPLEGIEPTDDDHRELEIAAARLHTWQNLMRLGQVGLAARLLGPRTDRETPVMTWRCILPGVSRYRFIGQLHFKPVPSEELFPIFLLRHFPDRMHPEWLGSYISRILLENAYFDGVATTVVKTLLRGQAPEALDDASTDELPISFLQDGSLLAPAHLMEPDDDIFAI